MIELNYIIEIIGSLIDKDLVLHKSVKQHPTFKIYKIFTYDLYELPSPNDKALLLSIKFNRNITSDDIHIEWKQCDKEYLKDLFTLLKSNGFNI